MSMVGSIKAMDAIEAPPTMRKRIICIGRHDGILLLWD
jgi:hypothetical protein